MVSTVQYTGYDLTGRTADLKSGQSVMVYVNPQDPADAVLHRDFGTTNVLLFGLGIIALVGGSLCVLMKSESFAEENAALASDELPLDQPWQSMRPLMGESREYVAGG